MFFLLSFKRKKTINKGIGREWIQEGGEERQGERERKGESNKEEGRQGKKKQKERQRMKSQGTGSWCEK